MDTINSVIATQYTQERIATAHAERLAKEARQERSRRGSRGRAFRRLHRPAVANGVRARR